MEEALKAVNLMYTNNLSFELTYYIYSFISWNKISKFWLLYNYCYSQIKYYNCQSTKKLIKNSKHILNMNLIHYHFIDKENWVESHSSKTLSIIPSPILVFSINHAWGCILLLLICPESNFWIIYSIPACPCHWHDNKNNTKNRNWSS